MSKKKKKKKWKGRGIHDGPKKINYATTSLGEPSYKMNHNP